MATLQDWPMARTVAEMTDIGVFGPECRFVSFKLDKQHTEQDQFASNVYYGTVTVNDPEGLHRRHRIVIKTKHQIPELRIIVRSDIQFHNEVLFYERILPFLLDTLPAHGVSAEGRPPPFCRYYYGRNMCGDLVSQDMIILENECTRGFQMSELRLHLDFDHLIVAIKALAKFHALSYRAKHVNPVGFADMVSEIKDTQWLDGQWMVEEVMVVELFSLILDRLTELRDDDQDGRLRRFREEFSDDVLQSLRDVMEPAEPWAVLCHGDFNRNNVMFQYDDGGRPMAALPFDMASVRYGSPALDLSFFLYMNTDRSTRDVHWDELLDAYCAALAVAVSDVADVVRVPDRKQLDAEMHERAFYGLAHVSFFVRVMMEEHKSVDPLQFISMTLEDACREMLKFGGEKATDVIVDAVQHFIDIRYADKP